MKPLSTPSATLIAAAAFCAAVGAAWLVGGSDESDAPAVVEVASRSEGAPKDEVQPPTAASAPLDATARQQLPTGEPVNIFATKSWEPPPPPPPPPSPPQAPPLPFSFMGMMTSDSGKVTYYLARGNQAYAVVKGEKIDNTYRVNGLNGQQLSFTYLPMNEKQMLSMPPAADGTMIGGASSSASPGSPPGRPARSAYSPEAPAPNPPAPPPNQGSPAAQGNARKGAAAPGSPPADRLPPKTPIANQVPQPLSFSPPPQFNMEQSLVTPIDTEPSPSENTAPNTGEAPAQPPEN